MSLLLEIQKQIEKASERILRLERSLRDNPGLPSIAANLDSAARLKVKLERQFSEVAARAGYDICRYRAFDDDDQPIVAGAFRAISDFQRILSVVYSALKHGRKERATVSDEVSRETGLGFAYAFAGSIGVVMTVRNEKTLLESTLMDESMETVFSLAKAKTSKDVLSFANELGPGPINALYEWADDNATNGLSAEIDWRKGDAIKKSIVVQRQELSQLRKTINETSSEESETFKAVGVLTMADVSKNKFKFKREGMPELRGTVEEGVIDEAHRAALPKTYEATIRKTTRVKFSTYSIETHYHLLRLKDINKGGGRGREKK